MFKAVLLDPFAGISGDMLLGALVDLGADAGWIQQGLGKLGLKGLAVREEKETRSGITATRVTIEYDEKMEAGKRSFSQITKIIRSSGLSDWVKGVSVKAFRILGEAEARIHGVDIEEVHFHELGGIDTIGDICGTAIALELLELKDVFTRPVAVGHGFVQCAHGTLPLPAPATAELLKGFHVFPRKTDRELTTPTGACLLKTFADVFPWETCFIPEKVGYGAGSRHDTEIPNLLRAWMITLDQDVLEKEGPEGMWEISVNLDDMTGEETGDLVGKALEKGAYDAWITQVVMKKARPGIVFTILCPEKALAQVQELIFSHTRTLGIRKKKVYRVKLPRTVEEVDTPFGKVGVKIRRLPGGREDFSVEFDDISRIAGKEGLSLLQVLDEVNWYVRKILSEKLRDQEK